NRTVPAVPIPRHLCPTPMRFTFTEDTALESSRFSCLKALSETQVDVGLTSSTSPRSRFLLAIHENGSPIMHIPPRPVLGPALSSASAQTDITSALMDAASVAMDGDEPGMNAALEAAGEAGVDAIHAYIDAGVPPPNSPVTVSGGWIYNRIAKTGVSVKGKGFNKPLYDTGALYNDFDFEVKSRDQK
ncbi:MAG: hypothetical protein K6E17_00500, partial [Clostridiales bacterium]|nr:hypothetical protein [Clostridiales bacterium]